MSSSIDNASVRFFQIQQYHPKTKEVPIPENHRRAVFTYKEVKKGPNKGKKPQAVYCDVPATKLSIQPEILTAVMVAQFEALQDALIKHLIMQKFNWKETKHGKLEVSSDEISIAKVAEHAAATGVGRLSGESIEAWFDQKALLPVSEMIAKKRGCSVDDDRVVEAATVFRAHFANLANTRKAVKQQTALAMMKVCNNLADSIDPDDEEAVDPMLDKLMAIIEPFTKDDADIAAMI